MRRLSSHDPWSLLAIVLDILWDYLKIFGIAGGARHGALKDNGCTRMPKNTLTHRITLDVDKKSIQNMGQEKHSELERPLKRRTEIIEWN
jgi:hypothetical protein